jgi:hypothetical protein
MIDMFDTVLNSVVSIWKKGGNGVFDGYGIESQALSLLKAEVPAMVQPGEGKELDTAAAFGIQTFMFFMRPQMVDDPPRRLNIHHWLQINRYTTFDGKMVIVVDPPSADGTMYDIENVINPEVFDHHIEVRAKLIEP